MPCIRRFGAIATLVMAFVLLGCHTAHAASGSTPTALLQSSPGPLLWTAPGNVDASPLTALACPSAALCVAGDRGGDILWSTLPETGAGWVSAEVDGSNNITAIACPASTLCVAVDGAGNVLSSTDPTGGATAWSVAKVDTTRTQNNTDTAGAVLLRSISCPTTSLCVAVDAAGNDLVSTNPTGGAGAWVINHIDTNSTAACVPTPTAFSCQPALVSVACSSGAQCAAVDFSGNILTTTTPLAPAWTSTSAPGTGYHSLWAITCPTATFCATVDGQSGHVISFDPANPGTLTVSLEPGAVTNVWCASAVLCLAAAGTSAGTSVLLGSTQPADPATPWSASSLGTVTAIACPSSAICLAVDGEGGVAPGVTAQGAAFLLRQAFFSVRRGLTIAALDRRPRETFTVTAPIPARVTLAWTVPGTGASSIPRTIASVSHAFDLGGTAQVTLGLDALGRRLFRAATRPLRVHAVASFVTATGTVVQQGSLSFRSPPHRRRKSHPPRARRPS